MAKAPSPMALKLTLQYKPTELERIEIKKNAFAVKNVSFFP
jgi:hypothetical protein